MQNASLVERARLPGRVGHRFDAEVCARQEVAPVGPGRVAGTAEAREGPAAHAQRGKAKALERLGCPRSRRRVALESDIAR